jgi:membrane fusion protein, heavy metal efflux system
MMLKRVMLFWFCAIATSAHSQPLDCIVVPRQVADLAFGAGGLVDSILVDRGDRVTKGQVLGYLDSTVENANLALAKQRLTEVSALETAQAQLKAAESKYRRSSALETKQIVATSKLEEAEVEYESARLKVVEQQEAMALKTLDVQRVEAIVWLRQIVSPFDGYVVERHVAPGEYVENRKALTVAEVDPVYADVIAPSALFSEVKKGQKVKVTLRQPAEKAVIADTSVIDPYVDGASGTFRVRLSIPNADNSIIPGFRCSAELGSVGQ